MSTGALAPKTDDPRDLHVVDSDLPEWSVEALRNSPITAWDIETSGLDWAHDRIATCQVYAPCVGTFLIRHPAPAPRHLVSLLEDVNVIKVFHHAIFDLRFMHAQWKADARSVFCTKIAAKILMPGSEKTTLQDLTRDFLGVHLDKSERLSNWLTNVLTPQQVDYAAADVLYLPSLMSTLHDRLVDNNRWDLAIACYTFLPTRVTLDVLGSGDVFAYK